MALWSFPPWKCRGPVLPSCYRGCEGEAHGRVAGEALGAGGSATVAMSTTSCSSCRTGWTAAVNEGFPRVARGEPSEAESRLTCENSYLQRLRVAAIELCWENSSEAPSGEGRHAGRSLDV